MAAKIGKEWLAVAVVAALTACGGGEPAEEAVDEAPPAAAPAPAATAPDAAPRLNDAEIAAVVVAANGIDVKYGEIAVQKATNPKVKQFAQTMITDHNAVNKSAGELVGKLGVTPAENDVSRSLEAGAVTKRAELESKSGAEFDRAYIANEVEYHKAVLNALDSVLIPNAANEELKNTLIGVKPAFQAHLQHAETLLRELGGA